MPASRRDPSTQTSSTTSRPNRPRYRFGARIAGGGMGEIVRAEKIAADGTVLDDQLVAKRMTSDLREHDEANARFVREVRLQKRLEHPNVMPILARNLSARPPWFVMRYAEHTLKTEIGRHGGDHDWIVTRMTEILAGVAHAHDRDVLHRDIKPANVLIDNGIARVADFGLGKDLGPDASARTRTAQEMGTRPYMAPEQVNEPKNVGKPADVYALGKLLCHLATGARPPALAVDLDSLPAAYRYWVARCCETKPDRRYADAREALEAFELLIAADPDDQDPIAVAEALAATADQADRGAEADTAIIELDEHLTRSATMRISTSVCFRVCRQGRSIATPDMAIGCASACRSMTAISTGRWTSSTATRWRVYTSGCSASQTTRSSTNSSCAACSRWAPATTDGWSATRSPRSSPASRIRRHRLSQSPCCASTPARRHGLRVRSSRQSRHDGSSPSCASWRQADERPR